MILSTENHNHIHSGHCLSSASSSSNGCPSTRAAGTPSPTKLKHAFKQRSPRSSGKRKRHDLHLSLPPPPSASLPRTPSSALPPTLVMSPPPFAKHAHLGPSCAMPLMMVPPGHMDHEATPHVLAPHTLHPAYHICTCLETHFAVPHKRLAPLITSTKWKYELQITHHLYYSGYVEEAVARHVELMLHQSRGVHHNLKVAFEWYESQLVQNKAKMRELAHQLRVFASYNIYFCKLMGWQCLWLEVSSTCQGNQVTKNFRYNSRARLPRYPPCPIHY